MKKVGLIILDGWGYGAHDAGDAVYQAKTPFMDLLTSKFPNAELLTDGEHVGLPNGQMGNSEVGHMNIGAGRVVFQDLVRINNAIEEGSFNKNKVLIEAFKKAKSGNHKLHFIGLIGEGGVHASQKHLIALTKMAAEFEIEKSYIHAFTDGRDTDPKSGKGFMQDLLRDIEGTNVQVASVIGRYYAMDRDHRWERVKLAYDLLTTGKGDSFSNPVEAIESAYSHGLTDEFITPSVIVGSNGNPRGTIEANDVVICFNFRTDRCREITQVLTQRSFEAFDMHPLQLHYTTMTEYDSSFKNVHVVFKKDNLEHTLGQVIANNGLKQIRIAETEKYPHVTFFFSGGREKEFEGESRLMVNSPKVATYDLQPEMSAFEVRDKIIPELMQGNPDFFCLNFANPDMVGHTGVFPAIVKACETVDSCLKSVIDKGVENDYSFIVIADHGNADKAINADGTPNTAHSTNPVPIILVDNDYQTIQNGILADVAPTILKLMGIHKPDEMTGHSLV